MVVPTAATLAFTANLAIADFIAEETILCVRSSSGCLLSVANAEGHNPKHSAKPVIKLQIVLEIFSL